MMSSFDATAPGFGNVHGLDDASTFPNRCRNFVGAVCTASIQSSSASVGILQALAATGMIPLQCGVYSVVSWNIGTYRTAALASIGDKDECQTYDSDPSAVQSSERRYLRSYVW